MNDLLMGVVVLLLVGMVVMMFKYARYIHSLPKSEIKSEEDETSGVASHENEDKGQ